MGFVGRGRLGRTIALGIAGALALAAARAPAAQGGELADLVERALREERRASAAPLPTREEVARNWDAFLTVVVKRAGTDAPPGPLRDELLGVLLGERHRLVDLLTDATIDAPTMVSSLFESSWDRLSPILERIAQDLPPAAADRYRSFREAGDLMRAAERLGVGRDLAARPEGLRQLAAVLVGSDGGDPLRFETTVDPELRAIFGFGPPIQPAARSPLLPDAAPRPLAPHPTSEPETLAKPRLETLGQRVLDWLVPSARASAATRDRRTLAERLNAWIPDRQAEVRQYVPMVHSLLRVTADEAASGAPRIGAENLRVFEDLVIATAWQESCWRQFVRQQGEVQPLVGPAGSVGLMQINARVWRGIYDQQGLEADIGYNGRAGTEILWYYLRDHALRAGEHREPGGRDNLARATYAAYNGGPRHLSRYRNPDTSAHLQLIDREFWRKYRAVKEGDEDAMLTCYPTPG